MLALARVMIQFLVFWLTYCCNGGTLALVVLARRIGASCGIILIPGYQNKQYVPRSFDWRSTVFK